MRTFYFFSISRAQIGAAAELEGLLREMGVTLQPSGTSEGSSRANSVRASPEAGESPFFLDLPHAYRDVRNKYAAQLQQQLRWHLISTSPSGHPDL